MHRGIRSLVLALALLLLASAAVQARPLRALSPAGLLGDLWTWVSSVFGSWSKEGGTMDPNGLQRQYPPPGSTSDAGSTMDPDG